MEGRHDHPKLKMNYPTVGVPKPGLTYNFTRVEDKDLIHFDQEANELFKPYNVDRYILRIRTASIPG